MRARGLRRIPPAYVVPIAALVVAACAGATPGEVETGPPPGAEPDSAEARAESPARSEADSTAELESLFRARRDSARMRFTEADVRFMTGMISHHAQALVMSDLAPTHGASPRIRTLAARIINAQKDEIATMQAWLRRRGQPVPEIHVDGLTLQVTGLGEDHGQDLMHMPGMLSREQLRELDRARGAEFDRLFLTYMIQHHRGAVTMVHDLFDTDGAAQDGTAFKLASDIQVDQLTEIARMERMLESLSGETDRR